MRGALPLDDRVGLRHRADELVLALVVAHEVEPAAGTTVDAVPACLTAVAPCNCACQMLRRQANVSIALQTGQLLVYIFQLMCIISVTVGSIHMKLEDCLPNRLFAMDHKYAFLESALRLVQLPIISELFS